MTWSDGRRKQKEKEKVQQIEYVWKALWFSFSSRTTKVPTPTMSHLVKALHCTSNITLSSHLRNLLSFALSTSSSSSSTAAVNHHPKSSLSNLGKISPGKGTKSSLVCIIAKIVMENKNKNKKCLIPLL